MFNYFWGGAPRAPRSLRETMGPFDCLAGLAIACAATIAAPPTATLPVYSVKPSEVVLPDGEKLGDYRRIVHPFKNWILICDESLKAKHRVCNITQTIVDQKGGVAFNWSLVATADGKPLMMMRIPAAAGVGQTIELAMGDRPDRIRVQTDRCDQVFCHAIVAVGDMLKRHIRAGTTCTVTYAVPSAATIALQAPLEGLFAALAEAK